MAGASVSAINLDPKSVRKIAENDFGSLGGASTLAGPALVDGLAEARRNR